MIVLPPEQSTVVLATKLTHPRLPATLVARDRLLAFLNNALAHRLTLVSASAGWGKTILLSAWIDRVPQPSAWLSLDELDNHPSQFWLALISTLRTCAPNIGTRARAMLQSSEQPSLTAVLTTLLNDLASTLATAPLVLVLDDYHVITDPAIHESMTFLLEHLPAYMHVVLATRVDPDLPIARWRARGELLEIRTADLRFTQAEITNFFAQMLGDALKENDVQRLEQRTEGWVTGLQLAALALRQRADRAAFVQTFTGNHRYVLDYVQDEILAQQPLPVQRFLLETAVLRRMNAALCTAITGDTASQAMLELLERNNLFVVPLDDERQWYRMHDLLREVLVARLHATEPELIPQLHGRAAHWFAAQHELREAITHALAAPDFPYAAALIERAAPELWLRGEAQTVQAWVKALPASIVQQHARLVLDAALRLLEAFHAAVAETYRKTQVEVEHIMARIEAVLDALPDAEVVLLRRRISLLKALIAAREAVARGDTERMRLLAEHSLALSEGEDVSWKLVALWISFWHTESLGREAALLIPQLLVAKQQVVETGNQLEIVRVMRWLAFAYMRAGHLRLAEAESLAALALMKQLGQHSATEGYFYLFLAWAYYAFNQLDKAASAVQRLLQIAQTWQQADLLIVGNSYLIGVALAQHDYATAEHALLATEALIEQERFATHTSVVVAARVEYWLVTGNLAAASAWSHQAVFAPETWNPNRKWEFLLLVRVYLAEGQYPRALAALQQYSMFLDRQGDGDTTIGFLSLFVVTLQGAGQHAQAQTVLVRLLALAAEENYVRVFLDAGEPMHQALQTLRNQPRDEEHQRTAPSSAFVAQLLVAFEQAAQNSPTSSLQFQRKASDVLTEPLTPREQEVLRLLLAGASNAAIAADLVISLATVKKHVSNVLGKLGAENRVQAMVRARALLLL